MTALTMHGGSRTDTTPADPYRFNPIRELHRAGIRVLTRGDIEWFAWRPRTDTIVIRGGLGATRSRGTLTLALAHRALGHWQNSLTQDIEARNLAARWLIPDHLAAWARRVHPTYGATGIAEHLHVSPAAVQIRLGLICGCLTNIAVYRGVHCGCRIGRQAA